MDSERVLKRTERRVSRIRTSMKCGLTPECHGEMEPRHSTLSYAMQEPYVEDVQLKCNECLTTQKHGIGLSQEEYEEELDFRDGEHTVNFVTEFESRRTVQRRLSDLGYKEL